MISIAFAKLAALYKEVKSRNTSSFSVPPSEIFDYLSRYRLVRDELISKAPGLYSDLPKRTTPLTAGIANSEH